MLLNAKKAKIRELTHGGPIPDARIPKGLVEEKGDQSPSGSKQKLSNEASTRAKQMRANSASTNAPAALTQLKRKRTPAREPQEDLPMRDALDKGDGDETQDEDDSVQGHEERDFIAERLFGVPNYFDEDVTEDEE